jgi:predicted nucleic acid-binding Zn ribbon protein
MIWHLIGYKKKKTQYNFFIIIIKSGNLIIVMVALEMLKNVADE